MSDTPVARFSSSAPSATRSRSPRACAPSPSAGAMSRRSSKARPRRRSRCRGRRQELRTRARCGGRPDAGGPATRRRGGCQRCDGRRRGVEQRAPSERRPGGRCARSDLRFRREHRRHPPSLRSQTLRAMPPSARVTSRRDPRDLPKRQGHLRRRHLAARARAVSGSGGGVSSREGEGIVIKPGMTANSQRSVTLYREPRFGTIIVSFVQSKNWRTRYALANRSRRHPTIW
jgi:hypothetical protein